MAACLRCGKRGTRVIQHGTESVTRPGRPAGEIQGPHCGQREGIRTDARTIGRLRIAGKTVRAGEFREAEKASVDGAGRDSRGFLISAHLESPTRRRLNPYRSAGKAT